MKGPISEKQATALRDDGVKKLRDYQDYVDRNPENCNDVVMELRVTNLLLAEVLLHLKLAKGVIQ